MLHCVHQLVTNSVCVMFGDGQVVYGGFIAENSCLLCLEMTLMRALKVRQNNKVAVKEMHFSTKEFIKET